jgi:hypothetical protein
LGRDKTPPIKGLTSFEDISDNATTKREGAQPYDIPECSGHGQQREAASHVGFVRELRYHTLDYAEVPADETIQEAAVVTTID